MDQSKLKDKLSYNRYAGEFFWLAKKGRYTCNDTVGYLSKRGYLRIKLNGKYYLAHRLAWLYVTGEWPKKFIDHINRDKSDNRFLNLRDVTHSQNQHNRLKQGKTKSKYKGITHIKKPDKWQAQICVNSKSIYLGRFKTEKEAGESYITACKKYHGDFATF